MIKRFLPGITACLAIFAGMDVAVAQGATISCPQAMTCSATGSTTTCQSGSLQCTDVKTGFAQTSCTGDNTWSAIAVFSANPIPDGTFQFSSVIVNGRALCKYNNDGFAIYSSPNSSLAASGNKWGSSDEGQVCSGSASNCPMSIP